MRRASWPGSWHTRRLPERTRGDAGVWDVPLAMTRRGTRRDRPQSSRRAYRLRSLLPADHPTSRLLTRAGQASPRPTAYNITRPTAGTNHPPLGPDGFVATG